MAKGSIKVARKYAKALSELYQTKDLNEVEAGLKEMASLLENNAEAMSALTNPAFNIDSRIQAAREIATRVKPNDEKFANFISLICQAGRINEVTVISESFSELVAEIKKLLSLKITSAFELPANEKDSFKQHIEKEFGSMATIEWNQDIDIIGGLKVRAGDKLLDGSLKGALKKLENVLLA